MSVSRKKKEPPSKSGHMNFLALTAGFRIQSRMILKLLVQCHVASLELNTLRWGFKKSLSLTNVYRYCIRTNTLKRVGARTQKQAPSRKAALNENGTSGSHYPQKRGSMI